MKYLLDTNAVIHLFNAKEPLSSKVMSHSTSDFAISGYTEAEIAYGVENSADEFRERNRALRSMGLAPFNRIYHDADISKTYGEIKAHLVKNKIYSPANEIDIFIAATAIAKDLTLITANYKDFAQVPNIKLQDWSK